MEEGRDGKAGRRRGGGWEWIERVSQWREGRRPEQNVGGGAMARAGCVSSAKEEEGMWEGERPGG